jgi:hypothetical protein
MDNFVLYTKDIFGDIQILFIANSEKKGLKKINSVSTDFVQSLPKEYTHNVKHVSPYEILVDFSYTKTLEGYIYNAYEEIKQSKTFYLSKPSLDNLTLVKPESTNKLLKELNTCLKERREVISPTP